MVQYLFCMKARHCTRPLVCLVPLPPLSLVSYVDRAPFIQSVGSTLAALGRKFSIPQCLHSSRNSGNLGALREIFGKRDYFRKFRDISICSKHFPAKTLFCLI
ncbi:hypothetical protein HOLleu_26783 [Holothuria leucospilota]|uniref:Uncharacterized protein n=1 Tax=Holothuria leucospilota TaxID=206669 RepID=A0A9Q1H287_HOLLE|nr:hypothetical protein HOLleu_26783 [Holothuria leucospilota]